MQTIGSKAPPSDTGRRTVRGRDKDLLPLLAGAAVAVGGVGATLALVDLSSPLRGPFTLFFLLAAPSAALAAALRALAPLGRAVAAVAGAVAVNLLVAQGMLALRVWSVRGGVVTVTVLSALALLLTVARRLRRRAARRWTT
ncbi:MULTISPECIES: hypothetical protein [unclassified Streptomyces]|uniref:hypothetical protein n=1 Tax=unclassified Streptomyces TaxID=2593676 RepID=UPI001CBF2922|nr:MULTISPECIES: hypothetical protein [unclassified Streptomyces]WPO74729.1 hypothetical protein R9806_30995 [Streptomyces sp. KN37]